MSARLSRPEIAQALRTGPRLSPSCTTPWQGRPSEVSRWTEQQLATLAAELSIAKRENSRGAHAVIAKLRDPEAVEAWPVSLELHPASGRIAMPDIRIVDCPLLARTRDGARILIVAPAGDKLWINAR